MGIFDVIHKHITDKSEVKRQIRASKRSLTLELAEQSQRSAAVAVASIAVDENVKVEATVTNDVNPELDLAPTNDLRYVRYKSYKYLGYDVDLELSMFNRTEDGEEIFDETQHELRVIVDGRKLDEPYVITDAMFDGPYLKTYELALLTRAKDIIDRGIALNEELDTYEYFKVKKTSSVIEKPEGEEEPDPAEDDDIKNDPEGKETVSDPDPDDEEKVEKPEDEK